MEKAGIPRLHSLPIPDPSPAFLILFLILANTCSTPLNVCLCQSRTQKITGTIRRNTASLSPDWLTGTFQKVWIGLFVCLSLWQNFLATETKGKNIYFSSQFKVKSIVTGKAWHKELNDLSLSQNQEQRAMNAWGPVLSLISTGQDATQRMAPHTVGTFSHFS